MSLITALWARFNQIKKEFHKYAIDLKKLHYNILALKYLKNANNVATFNPIEISNTLKELLENFLYDGEKIDVSDFDKLSHTEKRVLKRLYSFLKIDFDFDYNDQFQKRFEVMYGSWLAGNDNEDLKKEMKGYVKLGIQEAIISRQQGASMMHKLEKWANLYIHLPISVISGFLKRFYRFINLYILYKITEISEKRRKYFIFFYV